MKKSFFRVFIVFFALLFAAVLSCGLADPGGGIETGIEDGRSVFVDVSAETVRTEKNAVSCTSTRDEQLLLPTLIVQNVNTAPECPAQQVGEKAGILLCSFTGPAPACEAFDARSSPVMRSHTDYLS